MKLLSIAALTIAAFAGLCLVKSDKYRKYIWAAYFAAVLLLSVYLSVTTLPRMLSFYTPTDQTFYQKQFLADGDYPDAFLDVFLTDKVVYTKNDPALFDDNEPEGKEYVYSYYHMYNAQNFIKASHPKRLIASDDLNDVFLTDAQKEDFDELGITNDMFRNTVMYGRHLDEPGTYFSYLWYYKEIMPLMHAYVHADDLADAEEVLVLWDDGHEKEPCDLYIMSMDYYREAVMDHE